MNQLKVVENVLNSCTTEQLESLFGPAVEHTCSRAEMVSQCLNTELGAYGIKTQVAADNTTVFIDDAGMSKVLEFFSGKGYQPVLTQEHTERIGTLVNFAKKNKIDLIWAQGGLKKTYYTFKQYGFNGINLFNLLSINRMNAASVAISTTGSVGLTMGGAIALSWSGSVFLSTLEHYIPDSCPRIKLTVRGAKYGIALPIRCVEWTSNTIIGFIENVTIGHQLPINVTETYRLTDGPKLENITKVKKPLLNWLIIQLQNLNK